MNISFTNSQGLPLYLLGQKTFFKPMSRTDAMRTQYVRDESQRQKCKHLTNKLKHDKTHEKNKKVDKGDTRRWGQLKTKYEQKLH